MKILHELHVTSEVARRRNDSNGPNVQNWNSQNTRHNCSLFNLKDMGKLTSAFFEAKDRLQRLTSYLLLLCIIIYIAQYISQDTGTSTQKG